MRLTPEIRVPFANVRSRVAHTGASFAVMVAYLLFLLMFLTMIAEIFLVLMRALIDRRDYRILCSRIETRNLGEASLSVSGGVLADAIG